MRRLRAKKLNELPSVGYLGLLIVDRLCSLLSLVCAGSNPRTIGEKKRERLLLGRFLNYSYIVDTCHVPRGERGERRRRCFDQIGENQSDELENVCTSILFVGCVPGLALVIPTASYLLK